MTSSKIRDNNVCCQTFELVKKNDYKLVVIHNSFDYFAVFAYEKVKKMSQY